MGSIPSEMLRGHMDTIILLSLLSDDKHTNQIREEIEARGDGKFELKQGTFYSCLQRIVKQGYVTEYRSTSADGVRRKFYQLTEKGKIYIDDNKDKWAFSREVINTLISTPESKADAATTETAKAEPTFKKPNKPFKTDLETTEDVDKELQAFLSNQDSSEPVAPTKPLVSTISAVSDDEVEIIDFSDITAKAEADAALKKSQEKREEIKPETPLKQAIHKPIVPIHTKTPEEFEVYTLVGYDVNDGTNLSRSSIKDEPIIEEKQAYEVFPESSQESLSVDKVSEFKNNATPTTAAPAIKSQDTAPLVTDDVEDDYYNGETTVTHDYKAVLSKIFPAEKIAPAKVTNEQREIIYVEGTDIKSYFENDTQTKKQTQPDTVVEPTNVSVAAETNSKSGSFDFSDLKSLAKIEGFKIRLSGSATKQQINTILVNKLNLFTSIVFFILLATETLLLGYFTANNAGLTMMPFYVIASCMAILPAIMLIIYFVNPQKKIAALPSLKSIIELCIVIMLNLILIVIACGILYDIDFSNNAELLKFILYPFIAILNIPFYFIIKYLNLENSKFFSLK